MHSVIQYVSRAKVTVSKRLISQIDCGFVVLIGVAIEDDVKTAHELAGKISKLRIIPDSSGKLNLNLSQAKGEVLLISQFTLCADTASNRPSFSGAAPKDQAIKLLDIIKSDLETIYHIPVSTGQFGAHMEVELVNLGPVTIIF